MVRPAVFILFLVLCRGAVAQTEWHFTYWMPYDNNLDGWTDSIKHMMIKEMLANLSVSIQVDRAGDGGMRRLRLEKGRVISAERIDSDKSYSSSAFQQYLSWVTQTFDYKHHALIFLDHGGKLDEVGLDEYPRRDFLRVDSIRIGLEKELPKERPLDLLYFQVCAKGSIEPVFEVKDQADYILVSQNKLGAPNFYYQGLMKSMQKKNA